MIKLLPSISAGLAGWTRPVSCTVCLDPAFAKKTMIKFGSALRSAVGAGRMSLCGRRGNTEGTDGGGLRWWGRTATLTVGNFLFSHLSVQTDGDQGCVLDLALSCVNWRSGERQFYFC